MFKNLGGLNRRGFIWTSKAWYASALPNKESISFGMYDGDGGTSGEMMMSWYVVMGTPAARLECFDDGFYNLFSFVDVLEKLQEYNDKEMSQENFVDILKQCGFQDLTEYTIPEQSKGAN